jgi:Flp pilus assembly protein TadG
MYTVKMQQAVKTAASIAAQCDIEDRRFNYEELANAFVALATGLAEDSETFAVARSDFDYLLEQANS